MFRVHRYLLIIPFLLVFATTGGFSQQNSKSIHTLPVQPADPAAPALSSAPANPALDAPIPSVPPSSADNLPPVPSPSKSPAKNGPRPPTAQSTPEETIPKMEFPNADVKEVLAFYERLTGARIVYDNTVQGTVNIVISSPVSQREAVQIIETNLLLNGFSLIPAANNIIKVVGLAKNPRSTGVPIFSDPAMLPESDRVVTFLFRLRYADPTEMVQMLQAGYIAPSVYTAITALPKSQSIMVTESTPVIRGLIKIVQETDVPPAEVVGEFITLERADVKDVLEKLQKLFEKPQSQGGAGASVRANPVPNPAIAPAVAPEGGAIEIQGGSSLSEDSVIVGKITLMADVRTNRIYVITRPVNLPFVRQLIREFDSNVPFAQPVKRTLKFVPASEVLDIVVKAIAEPGVKTEETGGSEGKSTTKSTSQSSSSSSGGGYGGYGGGYGGGGYGGGLGGSGGMGIGGEDLSTEPVDTTPKAVTVGNTKIIADPRENTIIVLGNREIQSKVFALIDQIDVRAPQVMLNTVIGELSVNESSAIGVDYILHSGGILTGGSNIILPGAGHSDTISSFGSSNLVNTLAGRLGGGPGIAAILGLSNSLDVVVQALQATGRFKIIQRPMVFTSNNKKATIASGESIAVQTQSLSNVGNTSGIFNNNTSTALNASFQYIPVELKLEVVPLVNSDREVTMDIVQTLNSVAPTAAGSSSAVGGNPTITTRYLKTHVSVPNRGTVVLGGLIKRDYNNTTSGIPVLGKIPLLGYLFRSTAKVNDRQELVILIRPVVTRTPSETISNSETEQQRMIIEPDLDSTLNNAGPAEEKSSKSVPFRTQGK